MSDLSILFEPVKLGPITLPNRWAMAPMTRQFSPNRTPTEDVARYYQRRAEGGTGLIITEGTTLRDLASSGSDAIPAISGEVPVAGWAKVVEAVHAAGSKIFPQIWHMGVMRDAQASGHPEVESLSPSGLLLPGKNRGRAMTDAEVAQSIEDFAEAARNAKGAGFDGVELHGAHGYLIDQFFWEGTNTRTDQYGGDMVARTRYAYEVIRAVRAAVGPDYPIMLRYSQWKQQDFESKLAPTPEALEAFLAPLTDAGLDAYHCSTRRYWEPEFEGSALNLAGWTKKLTGLATVTVGSVGLNQDFVTGYASEDTVGTADIDGLAERVEAGEFDVVAVGRALIATPNWPKLMRAGQLSEAATYSRAQLAELV